MTFKVLQFSELTVQQLYDILRLRSEVFVVEQDCVYQDIDNYDQVAFHILGYVENVLVAYSRILPPKTYFNEISIGRVIVKEAFRKHNYGHELMSYSINFIFTHYPNETIKISAQQYLIKFYASHGFKVKGEGYLEDGIPHIAMLLKSNV
jgi:ElaA protein